MHFIGYNKYRVELAKLGNDVQDIKREKKALEDFNDDVYDRIYDQSLPYDRGTTLQYNKNLKDINKYNRMLDTLEKSQEDLEKLMDNFSSQNDTRNYQEIQNDFAPPTRNKTNYPKEIRSVQKNQLDIEREIQRFKIELKNITEEHETVTDELEDHIVRYPNGNPQSSIRIKYYDKLDDLDDRMDEINDIIQTLTDQHAQLQYSKNDLKNPPRGSGLKKRRGRPKGSGIAFKDNIDHDKGIQPVKKYHPFGKYFINSHKLNHGNVLSIRSKSGTNVREYPSRTVSPHMANIVKTIVGGGVPSYNDMEKLTNDEKDYLYKISKRAEFADKISIPTPSKDQQEKDIHEFEVCKGEIMAGNDSKELIKKFKLLIIKLSKNGTIPKREANEVMTELLELGY